MPCTAQHSHVFSNMVSPVLSVYKDVYTGEGVRVKYIYKKMWFHPAYIFRNSEYFQVEVVLPVSMLVLVTSPGCGTTDHGGPSKWRDCGVCRSSGCVCLCGKLLLKSMYLCIAALHSHELPHHSLVTPATPPQVAARNPVTPHKYLISPVYSPCCTYWHMDTSETSMLMPRKGSGCFFP